jgi:hypothetical protein
MTGVAGRSGGNHADSDKPRCTRIKTDGERCRNFPRRGISVCTKHGGNSPNLRKAAARRQLEHKALSEFADFDVKAAVASLNPYMAYLEITATSIAFHQLMRQQVAELAEISHTTRDGSVAIEAALTLYENAETRAAKNLAQLLRLNLQEQALRIEAEKARLVVKTVDKVLERLGLSTEQRAIAPSVVRAEFSKIADLPPAVPNE